MTDETQDVPMTEPPSPDPVAAGSDWASPPAWGHTPRESWGQPRESWEQPRESWEQPRESSGRPGASGAGSSGGGWNYGYGGLWTPPPEPPARPPNPARRVLAAIAIAVLVLVSGSLGAVISAAVNGDTSTPPAAAPFNDPLGSLPIAPQSPTGETSAIAEKVSPALVNIYTTIETATGRGQAAGTGMIVSSTGEVLTNNHVIADSATIRVEIVETGETRSAEVLGYNVKDDVALLQIDDVSGLNTVSFADATQVQIGDPVVAIGNAGGRGGDPTVTTGSVTALGQQVTAGDEGTGLTETLLGMIEVSAPIEPGDSGGPLVNENGRVIGMNTAAATNGRSGQVSSTAFAIPINRVVRIAQQIRDGEESERVHVGERGLLGVRVQNIETQSICDVTATAGAFVAAAEPDSPADDAGLGECDVIVAIDDKIVTNTSDLNDAMFPYHPDEVVSVRWIDESGATHEADVTLMLGPPA